MSYLTQFDISGVLVPITTLTGDAGGAIAPVAGNINLLGGNVLTTTGAGNTITFDLDNGTNGQVLLGGGADPLWATIASAAGTIVFVVGANTLNLETGATVPVSFPTDAGIATPAVGVLTVAGGTGISTSGAGSTVTVTLDTPVVVADGGTGSTSFTAGSVIFSDGLILTENNSNLFWDDTNNRLGIGTTTPQDELHVVGGIDLHHTAVANDEHALEIEVDTAGFSDIKAIDIVYDATTIAQGEAEAVILVNIDESTSTGGEIVAFEVLSTEEGSAVVYGLKTGINVNPIFQDAGTFGNADTILVTATNQTIPLSGGGAGNITVFVLDNDTMTIGDAAQFSEIEFIVDTGASGAGIAPTFEFSTGVGTWTTFSPVDGTNGFRNTGEIIWDISNIPTWAVGTGVEFLIRITRTRNMLSIVPILDLVQISAVSEFIWDEFGDVNFNTLTLASPLTVPNGGTGVIVTTAFAVLCGGTTTTNPLQSIASVGTAAQVLTSNGAGALPTFQAAAGGGLTWAVTTVNASIVVNNGYIADKVGLLTMTLPASGAIGDIIEVTNINTAVGWRIAQNALQAIRFGSLLTTIGVGGYLEATVLGDSVRLVCTVSGTSTRWLVLSSLGNITVV